MSNKFQLSTIINAVLFNVITAKLTATICHACDCKNPSNLLKDPKKILDYVKQYIKMLITGIILFIKKYISMEVLGANITIYGIQLLYIIIPFIVTIFVIMIITFLRCKKNKKKRVKINSEILNISDENSNENFDENEENSNEENLNEECD